MQKTLASAIGKFGVDPRLRIQSDRYAIILADEFTLDRELHDSLPSLASKWDNLGADPFFGGGENATRSRRYSDFEFTPATNELKPLDHVAYFQSKGMNPFVGGTERHFEDVEPSTIDNVLFQGLVQYDFETLPVEETYVNAGWICQIHQIRIVVHPGKTYHVVPEGIHSDGYPFAGVHLIGRQHISGGESTVFTWQEEPLASATFTQPLDTLIFEDRRMKHYVSPITADDVQGHRDILAISFSLPGSPYETIL